MIPVDLVWVSLQENTVVQGIITFYLFSNQVKYTRCSNSDWVSSFFSTTQKL
jgi:hypothetical protein